jgi:carbamoyl-phosphate synthase small subunit
MKKAALALEDGTTFLGTSFGADTERSGEVVFNTSMTGYQEVVTDPSYKGQLVVMTYPQIGNYGITTTDMESRHPFLEGLVVREASKTYSNFAASESLQAFLTRHGVPGIEGVDTRALTRRLRDKGAMRAVLSTSDLERRSLVAKARSIPKMVGLDLAKEVTCVKPFEWKGDVRRPHDLHVVVVDFGVKYSILRCLEDSGCKVTVVPAQMDAADIRRLSPDGVVLSNGPGDPEPVSYGIETAKRLLDAQIPLFGICLGHQIMGLAFGGRTYKLKFGHHGANHPVKELASGKIEITAQNHGFCVDMGSLPKAIRSTHVNLNDMTCEGMEHAQLPAFSVQYHPEAGAGPHDSRYLFKRFTELMKKQRAYAKT